MEPFDLQGHVDGPSLTIRYEKARELNELTPMVHAAITEAADAGFTKLQLMPLVVHTYTQHGGPMHGKPKAWYIQPIIAW